MVADGAAEPADFGAFGQGMGEDGDGRSTLVNPALTNDGRVVFAFFRGRGIGDCGVITSFALEGGRPTIMEYAVMDECQGVMPHDWPVLYSAELSTE